MFIPYEKDILKPSAKGLDSIGFTLGVHFRVSIL